MSAQTFASAFTCVALLCNAAVLWWMRSKLRRLDDYERSDARLRTKIEGLLSAYERPRDRQ